jgi:hypothetical protein
MSEDTFTEITSDTWPGRIGGAFKGIGVGLVLFIAAFPVLFWNEGRAVKRFKTLNEGAGVVISLPEARVLPENEGELVHVTGTAVTDEIVSDPEFEVAVNAIKLKRKVEMYQWKENKKRKTKKKLGGGKETVTIYSYSKSWSSSLINSSNFKKPGGHQNPYSMPYKSQDFVASEVSLGEFKLSRSLVGKINASTVLPAADHANIEDTPDAEFHGNGIYIGDNPSAPQIGDLRITYRIVGPTDVSIVSRQINQSFEPYRARAGGTINMLNPGIVGADNMFRQAQQSNAIWTWIFRAGGFILMLVGVAMILRPLSVFADVIPFLGSVAGAGTAILSLLIAAPFAFLTIAVAWLRYRPLIGITLLVLTVMMAAVIFIISKRGTTSRAKTLADSRRANKSNRKDLKSDRIEQAASNEITEDGIEIATPTVNEMADDGIGIGQSAARVQAIQKNAADILKKGQNYFRTGQYDKAVMQFSQAIKSGDNRKVALYNRGVALFKLNKRDAALKDFKYAAKLGHDKARAILNQIPPDAA